MTFFSFDVSGIVLFFQAAGPPVEKLRDDEKALHPAVECGHTAVECGHR